MNFPELSEIFDRYRTEANIFHDLMPFKVQEILLVATLYDAFILERDGQLSQQIFGEYYQLNLSSAPRITSAYGREDALRKLARRPCDLVIVMVGLDVQTPLEIAAEIKAQRDVPILLFFNNSVALPLCPPADAPEMKAIDRVFVWNGYSKVFLAMTKYVEDRRNADNDTALGMVQVILLVEDSVRFYSRYLPLLFVEIMKQTQRLIAEEKLDEVHKLLRMRARPKVLLATSREEAMALYEKYEKYLLAVVTDVQFPCAGGSDAEAGLEFAAFLKERRPDLPVLVQSSEVRHEVRAHELGASFLYKHADRLSFGIRSFLMEHLGFGSFVFRMADGTEIARAEDFPSFERLVREVPEESLVYHATRNHFSAWLMAHGEVLLARALRGARVHDFESTGHLRAHLQSVFEQVRWTKVRGRIIHFDRTMFSSCCVARLANGSLGGKGRGTAFIGHLLENIDFSQFTGMAVRMPRTAIIGIDAFEGYLDRLQAAGIDPCQAQDYEELRRRFLEVELPEDLVAKLREYTDLVRTPVAVRSSGLFEDMLLQPFAGIYDTYLIPNSSPDLDVRLQQLCDAIRMVYVSIYSPTARAYFESIGYKLEEERMAIVLQEVVGNAYDGYFYPHISGTAQSFNYYPVAGLAPGDGIANIALGLGEYVVEGGQCHRFCPRRPKMELVAPEAQVQASQRYFYALNLQAPPPDLVRGEMGCYERLDIAQAESHGTLGPLVSVWDIENHRLQPGLYARGPRILDFANILKYESLPLAKTIEFVLELGAQAMGNPIEIEFAVDLARLDAPVFYLLQIKPLLQSGQEVSVSPEELDPARCVVFSDMAMGNGRDATVHDIVYAIPERFDNARTLEMAEELEAINRALHDEGRHAVFIGFGRWGTRDRSLGIPVRFHQISRARMLVEAALPDFQVDSSLGSHFFHNLTSMNIGYCTVGVNRLRQFVNWEWLASRPAVRETAHFRHVRTQEPLEILMDGRQGLTIVRIPENAPEASAAAGICEAGKPYGHDGP